MKKLIIACVAFVALAACTKQEKAPFNYRGLDFTMPVAQFVDSMTARGFVVDSAASDSGRTVVFATSQEPIRVLAAFSGDKLQVIQESHLASSNDSTRMLWQQIRDGLEKELGAWPDCPILKDDHKIANFDTSDGFISVILENTYTPTLTVRYEPKKEEK
jgi:hypothetical protein